MLVLVSLLLFSIAMKAQEDTLHKAPTEITTVDEGYQNDPLANKPVYFSEKQLQSNKGGPDSTQLRKVPDSIIKKLQANDDFWYVNYPFTKKKKETDENVPVTEGAFFQTILWLVIIGGFAAFLVGSMAMVTLVRQDRQNITRVVNRPRRHGWQR